MLKNILRLQILLLLLENTGTVWLMNMGIYVITKVVSLLYIFGPLMQFSILMNRSKVLYDYCSQGVVAWVHNYQFNLEIVHMRFTGSFIYYKFKKTVNTKTLYG